MDWTKVGYPDKHYEVVSRDKRYARNVWVITGSVMVITLLATFYFGLHPGVATFGIVIFILFGLLGGLLSVYDTVRYVRLMPYFERKLGEIDTFLCGRALARYLMQLDTLAVERGVQPISSFGFADDLRGEKLVWHDVQEGLQCIDALHHAIESDSVPAEVRNAIASDLAAWEMCFVELLKWV